MTTLRSAVLASAGRAGQFGSVKVGNPVRIIGRCGVGQGVLGLGGRAAKGRDTALLGVAPGFAGVKHSANGRRGNVRRAVLRDADDFQRVADMTEVQKLAGHTGHDVRGKSGIACGVSVRESRGGHADRPPVLRVFTAGGRVVVVRVVAGGWLGPLAGWVCGDGLGQPWWVMVAASGTRWVAVPGQESFKRRALGWPASRSCAGGEDLGQVGQGFQTVAFGGAGDGPDPGGQFSGPLSLVHRGVVAAYGLI